MLIQDGWDNLRTNVTEISFQMLDVDNAKIVILYYKPYNIVTQMIESVMRLDFIPY